MQQLATVRAYDLFPNKLWPVLQRRVSLVPRHEAFSTHASSQAVQRRVVSNEFILIYGSCFAPRTVSRIVGGAGGGGLDQPIVAARGGGLCHVIEVLVIWSIFITRSRRIVEIVGMAIDGKLVVLAWRAGGGGFDVGNWGVGQIAITGLGIEELHGDSVCNNWGSVSVDWTGYR